jgi:hypothetical protein
MAKTSFAKTLTDFHYKPNGEVLRQYMRCDDFFRGIRGPVGSGKSVGSAVELFRRACQQEPNDKGKRRTRWAVIRNTGPQLKTTTIKTWLDWFPEDTFGPFRWGVPFTHHIMVDDLDMEVIFLALDAEEDIRKLLSLELTGVWANEAREMPKSIIDACTMRCGRFPSMREGGPSWYGMIADTNAPEDDHWWPIMAGDAPLPEFITDQEALMLVKPEGWKFFNQPPAMNEIKNEDGDVTGYEISDIAENRINLTPEYYRKIIAGKKKDWIDVYIMNRLGTVSEGKVIYPNFNDQVHISKDQINVAAGRTIYVGLDFGFHPAAIFAQRFGRGQWNIIDEIVADDLSTPAFAREIKATLKVLTTDDRQEVRIFGDPAGDQRTPGREDKATSFKILKTNGIIARPAPSNDPTIRIEAVKSVIDRMIDGRPALLVSPKCVTLKKGFTSGYCRRRINSKGPPRYEERAAKNKYSHPHDALQYMFLGAGEGRTLTQGQSNTKTKGKAKTKWPVFGRKKRRAQTSQRTTF